MKCPIIFNYELDTFYDAEDNTLAMSDVASAVNDLAAKLKLAVVALEHYANRFGNKVAAEALKQIGEQR